MEPLGWTFEILFLRSNLLFDGLFVQSKGFIFTILLNVILNIHYVHITFLAKNKNDNFIIT